IVTSAAKAAVLKSCLARLKSCPSRSCLSQRYLSLALFVFRIGADHTHHAFAVDDFALITNFLYRCPDLHKFTSLSRRASSAVRARAPVPTWSFIPTASLITINNSSAIQIVGREFDRDFVSGQNADKIFAHLAGNVRQYLVLVFQFHLEHGVGQRFQDRCHNFNRVFLTHSLLRSAFSCQLSATSLRNWKVRADS